MLRSGEASDDDAEGLSDAKQRAAISTNADAYTYIQRRVREQVVAGVGARVAPEKRVPGDSGVRVDFLSLLVLRDQRKLFLWTLSSVQHAAQRLRSIFGAPPYPWLLSEDAFLLSAAGIAPSRKNMSAQGSADREASGSALVLNYHQFGVEHFVDELQREYRVFVGSLAAGGAELFIASELRRGARVDMVCRIPKTVMRRVTEGRPVFKKRKQSFPVVGETLTLRQAPALRALRSLAAVQTVRLVVSRVQPRALNSATALVEARRV